MRTVVSRLPCLPPLDSQDSGRHGNGVCPRLFFGFVHLGRAPFAMKQDEPLDPTRTGILRAQAVVPPPNRAAYRLHERPAASSTGHVTNPCGRDYTAYNNGIRTGHHGQHRHRQGAGLRGDPHANSASRPPAPSLLRWRRAGLGGQAGYTEMFRNCAAAGLQRGAWKSSDGVCK